MTATVDTDRREATALAVRGHIVRMAGRGGCFIGASLSCVDLIVHLYDRVLSIDPDRLDDPDRDVLLLSKGHDVPALYGTFAEMGLIDSARLERHLDPDDDIYWHPNRSIPGVEFHSGSLGHNLPVAVGIALEQRLSGLTGRTVVIVGDGELDAGSNWEAILVAAAHRLDHLVVVVDRNGFQANMPTESLIPLEPLTTKFRSFGFHARRVDGHDFDALDHAFTNLETGRPTAIIADTVRGRGIPSLEARADRWFMTLDDEQVTALLAELHGEGVVDLRTEAEVVR